MDFVRNRLDAIIKVARLGSCRMSNVEIAKVALKHMNEFEPNNLANLFMLSNIYKDLRRLEDVARLNIAMRDIMFKKLSRFSVIGCNDSVVELYSLDERHPEIESIYQSLKGLTTLLRLNGYVLNLVDVAHGN